MTAFEDSRASDVSAGQRFRSGERPSSAASQPEDAAAPQRFGADSPAPALGESARHMTDTVKDQAQEALSQARRGADRLIDQQKSLASDRIEGYAQSMRQAAQCLTDQNPQIGRLLDQTAGRLGSAGTYLRDHQVSDMLSQVNRLGRQHPLILLGGMFVAGALVARFLKASQQRTQPNANGDDREHAFEEYAEAPFISRDQDQRADRDDWRRQRRDSTEVRSSVSPGIHAGMGASSEDDRGNVLKGGME